MSLYKQYGVIEKFVALVLKKLVFVTHSFMSWGKFVNLWFSFFYFQFRDSCICLSVSQGHENKYGYD